MTSKLNKNEKTTDLMKRFSAKYNMLCLSGDYKVLQPFRNHLNVAIETRSLLKKIVVIGRSSCDDVTQVESIEPLIRALRSERYLSTHLISISNLHLNNQHVILLAEVFEGGIYPIRHFELIDCVFSFHFILRLSRAFNICATLTTLILDYNVFGDEGCLSLCEGLTANGTIQQLSLNYCSMGKKSGAYLGNLINTSAIRIMHVDGNDLECEGLIALISGCVGQAVLEADERRIIQEQNERQLEHEERRHEEHEPRTRTKIAHRRRRSKSKRQDPPPRGPWLHCLHVADNCIDSHGSQAELEQAIQYLSGLISCSMCLQELDIEDNLIGEDGGREIVDALRQRKEYELPGLRIRTTHRMDNKTFTEIMKLSKTLKKKKKVRRRKKKGKKT